MSILSSPDEANLSLPGTQGDGLDSQLTSENFEYLCDDEPRKTSRADKCFSQPQNPHSLDHSKIIHNNTFLKSCSKSYFYESNKCRTLDDIDDLIQSHITAHEELDLLDSSPGHSAKSNEEKCYHAEPFFHSNSLENNLEEVTPSKTNFNSKHPGQVWGKKRDNVALRTKSTYGEASANVETSPFKKQIPMTLNPSDVSQQTQVKTKLRTLWNNVKYGWRVKREVNLKLDSATWLLGQCYHNKLNDGPISHDVVKELKHDLLSKIWLTYRINFPKIPGTDLVSDSGWGCMLRCGQMMMAQALVCHFLQRDWRVSFDQPPAKKVMYKRILRWFGDSLSEHSPFSLHHLVSLGENYGRKAGDWYGPTHAAQVLRDALIHSKRDHNHLRNICMYVALDGIVFKQDVFDLCADSSVHLLPATSHLLLEKNNTIPSLELPGATQIKENLFVPRHHSNAEYVQRNQYLYQGFGKDEDESDSLFDQCPSYSEFGPPSFNSTQLPWTSLIIFVSVRLGNDKINSFYIPCLKSLLAYEHCIGIIGGRPKHALYFIGWQDDKLIHMDPHSCQSAIDMENEHFNEKSFHSSSIRTMSFSEMDPSCAIGFYFRRREEFQLFLEKFSEITAPMKRNLDYPVFALAEGKRVDIEEVDIPHTYAKSSFSHACRTDEDDYILL